MMKLLADVIAVVRARAAHTAFGAADAVGTFGTFGAADAVGAVGAADAFGAFGARRVDALRRVGLVSLLALLPAAVQAAALGADDARHLLTRSGFAPTEREVKSLAGLNREQAVEQLLAAAGAAAHAAPPAWVQEPVEHPARVSNLTDAERRAFQQREALRNAELKAWWMTQMLQTPAPLAERMTLFWHNHFVSSAQKVRAPQLMYRQHLLLRQHALRNFGALLHAAAKDPAMLIYLDAATSRKGQPNENFAREVMELFTLGEGHYSERDIKEAARAFTGWSVDREDSAAFLIRRMQHDDGVKTVLGRSGNFDGDAVLDILLAQPAAAEFIVTKLWREFVSPDADAPANRREIVRIANAFRASRYDIQMALRGIFTSPRFYAPEHRAALVKSPVELVAGTVRQFGVRYTDALPFAMLAAGLGQNLFAPPNVRGWPGGEAWINSTTLLARKQFIERLFRVDGMHEAGDGMAQAAAMGVAMGTSMGAAPEAAPRRAEFGQMANAGRVGPEGRERLARAAANIQFDSGAFLAQFGIQPPDTIRRAVLPAEPATPPAAQLHAQGFLKALLLDPVYQLK